MIRAKAKAKLIFEVEFDISSGWGADCTVAQVEKQAKDEANQIGQSIIGVVNGSWEGAKHRQIRFLSMDSKITVELGEAEGGQGERSVSKS